jgi:hypothetical protein
MITNTQSGTNVHEIADGIYRINTPVAMPDGFSFNFNQYLIDDDAPLLFHTGHGGCSRWCARRGRLIAVERCATSASRTSRPTSAARSTSGWRGAPRPTGCGRIGAMVSVNDVADRPPRARGRRESLARPPRVRWFDTPHMPHGWDCGLMMESSTRTFLCGDLFTQGGPGEIPLTESDILGPSEAFRAPMDYYAHAPDTAQILERLARERPTTLACMHGSAFRGDGAALLRALASGSPSGSRCLRSRIRFPRGESGEAMRLTRRPDKCNLAISLSQSARPYGKQNGKEDVDGQFTLTTNVNPVNGIANTGVFDPLIGIPLGYKLSFEIANQSLAADPFSGEKTRKIVTKPVTTSFTGSTLALLTTTIPSTLNGAIMSFSALGPWRGGAAGRFQFRRQSFQPVLRYRAGWRNDRADARRGRIPEARPV